MEGINKSEENLIAEKKVNYLYDDISGISTSQLKSALNGYRNFNYLHDSGVSGLTQDNVAEASIRIEGELLSRKEMIMEDIPEEEKVLEEVDL